MSKRSRSSDTQRDRRRRKKQEFVAGATRTAGAYMRSLPGSPEKKFLDTVGAFAASSATGTIVPSLNLIPQNTTDNGRLANRVIVRNINVYASIRAVASAVAGIGEDIIRVILYIDKQCNGAAATVATASDGVLETAAYDSFRNMDNVQRFHIIKDKFISLDGLAGAASNSANQMRFFKMSWKGELPVVFSSTTGAITEIQSNNIGILFISQAGGTNFGYTARVKYTES